MKKNLNLLIIPLSIYLLLVTSCRRTPLQYSSDPVIIGNIEDIVADEGQDVFQYNLEQVYIIQNQANALPENRVYANSNATLLKAEILDNILYLRMVIGQTGSAEVTIRSEIEGFFRDDLIRINITGINANQAIGRGINYFESQDYALAEFHFKLTTLKNDADLLSDAYLGLGFSRMRLGSEEYNRGYEDLKISLGLNPENIDAIAGISMLEYSVKGNYPAAISLGRAALNKDENFVFRYDNSFNKSDVLLNIALSQYSSLLFDDCLASIIILDPSTLINAVDVDFKTQLSEKLQQLIVLYN